MISDCAVTTFTLPDELKGYTADMEVFFYDHINTLENNNSRLKLTRHCVSIGINGHKVIKTPEGNENFAEGDVVFYRPGNYLSYENFDNLKPYRCLMIFFNASFLSVMIEKISLDFSLNPTSETGKMYFSVRSQPYINTFIQSFEYLNGINNGFTADLQKIKLLELVYFLAGISSHELKNLIQSKGSVEEQFNVIVEKNLDSNLTLEELAFLCNMSLAGFKRLFIRTYGLSPGKWLKEKRLKRAAAQIKINILPKAVFLDAGYADYSSFSHAFKQMFGVCPRKFKNI